MKIYQIVEDYSNSKHAGSKATNDAVAIFSEFGAEKISVIIATRESGVLSKVKRQVKFLSDWIKVYKTIEANSVLVIQNPFTIRQLGRYQVLMKLKSRKNVRILSLIHDVELLRYDKPNSRNEFKETLEIADQLIVHNDSMKQWFIKQGVSESRLVSLEIFDYLNDKSSDIPTEFSKKVIIAGNLAKEKSPYVYELGKVSDVSFDLLGVNFETLAPTSNINYRGAFPPDDVPNELSSGFGLVWDGPSVESCVGETGDYLRYNNPHKLSLYISSSLPVVIWSEAAEAKFVEQNQVGITVSSLHELKEKLDTVSEADYQQMVANTKKIKEQLQAGHYLKTAISTALKQLGK
ncbi:sugar transferase [Streptococcus caballi]|uniref:sugar transferase n=1 Tax=Streptococcus caballi TaxID=439220 RepID=UPI000376D4D4|nr:sugar transferase [Streptococcus caballi]